ncbi:hypothetical protein D1646_13535 [Pseudoflavonifractor sp. 60]|uniref:hypothetical protein n=1 Tax=Pseudoflavonifractor sp. 60 TaxID=2304576 RepID=UPI0013699DB8|nr:hypothetical protein [Pseudoflavonifractor sp. 60]NBI67804.1 hypothetical protein [Pseudoflavonifractor sp. 60]
MKNNRMLRAVIMVAIAILAEVGMTVLSAFPPLSLAYQWAEQNDLKIIWYGIEAGIISLCLLYYAKR